MIYKEKKLCLVDAHVHIYPCFDLPKFLDSACSNFNAANSLLSISADYTGVLLLSETVKDNVYGKLREYAKNNESIATRDDSQWTFNCLVDDETSLIAERESGECLLIMAGRQIVTKEGLEILALITTQTFDDGNTTERILHQIHESGAIPVIPWGVGKWLGRRGKYLSKLLTDNSLPAFFLGDNSGRPSLWQKPSHFVQAQHLGFRILPGTDPLPLPTENGRVGKFGFYLQHELSMLDSGGDLRKQIRDSNISLHAYGLLEKNFKFLYNQILIRMK